MPEMEALVSLKDAKEREKTNQYRNRTMISKMCLYKWRYMYLILDILYIYDVQEYVYT